eukprot:scaffold372764_cov45-Prasinocladus_malaysianus.AAC.2
MEWRCSHGRNYHGPCDGNSRADPGCLHAPKKVLPAKFDKRQMATSHLISAKGCSIVAGCLCLGRNPQLLHI